MAFELVQPHSRETGMSQKTKPMLLLSGPLTEPQNWLLCRDSQPSPIQPLHSCHNYINKSD